MLYYVNKNAQTNGDHEVHNSGCSFLSDQQNRLYLGTFDSCGPAAAEAKRTYPSSNGCFFCSRACNTG